MTVEELIAALRQVPSTAVVVTRIRQNESFDGKLEPLYEYREAQIEGVVYSMGVAIVQLDE